MIFSVSSVVNFSVLQTVCRSRRPFVERNNRTRCAMLAGMVAARKLDTTIYPETDHMGEGELQQLIDEFLRPLLARFLLAKGRTSHVGSNTFLYYRQFDSSKRIAPDIYVLAGVPQSRIGRAGSSGSWMARRA